METHDLTYLVLAFLSGGAIVSLINVVFALAIRAGRNKHLRNKTEGL